MTDKIVLECPHIDCDKSYTSQKNFDKHIEIHLNARVKAFVCTFPECTRSFDKETNLKKHSYFHKRTRKTCTFPGCNKSFWFEKRLITHWNLIHQFENVQGQKRKIESDSLTESESDMSLDSDIPPKTIFENELDTENELDIENGYENGVYTRSFKIHKIVTSPDYESEVFFTPEPIPDNNNVNDNQLSASKLKILNELGITNELKGLEILKCDRIKEINELNISKNQITDELVKLKNSKIELTNELIKYQTLKIGIENETNKLNASNVLKQSKIKELESSKLILVNQIKELNISKCKIMELNNSKNKLIIDVKDLETSKIELINNLKEIKLDLDRWKKIKSEEISKTEKRLNSLSDVLRHKEIFTNKKKSIIKHLQDKIDYLDDLKTRKGYEMKHSDELHISKMENEQKLLNDIRKNIHLEEQRLRNLQEMTSRYQ